MSKVTEEQIKQALKPFDVVTHENGDVGFIHEVSVNECQNEPVHQIKYSVSWLTGFRLHTAWFYRHELTYQCNLMTLFAEQFTHPFGENKKWVKPLLGDSDE